MRDGNAKPLAWIAAAALILILTGLAYLAAVTGKPMTNPSPPRPSPNPHPNCHLIPLAKSKPVAPLLPTTIARSKPKNRPHGNPEATPAPTDTARTDESVAQSPAAAPQTLAERIAATEEWLNSTPVTHYFIQLLSTDGNNERGVEIFIDNVSKSLDPMLIRVYRSSSAAATDSASFTAIFRRASLHWLNWQNWHPQAPVATHTSGPSASSANGKAPVLKSANQSI